MNFLLDHDVPLEAARLLQREGHSVKRLIILIRRRTRQAECARLLHLIRTAGTSGIEGNTNFA
jgi:hypothetical protein